MPGRMLFVECDACRDADAGRHPHAGGDAHTSPDPATDDDHHHSERLAPDSDRPSCAHCEDSSALPRCDRCRGDRSSWPVRRHGAADPKAVPGRGQPGAARHAGQRSFG